MSYHLNLIIFLCRLNVNMNMFCSDDKSILSLWIGISIRYSENVFKCSMFCIGWNSSKSNDCMCIYIQIKQIAFAQWQKPLNLVYSIHIQKVKWEANERKPNESCCTSYRFLSIIHFFIVFVFYTKFFSRLILLNEDLCQLTANITN